jgi:hypothetical protein
MVPTTWKPVEWKSKNTWATVLDQEKLFRFLENAASRIIARKMVNRFKKQFSLYISIFEFSSCDCLTGHTNCFEGEVISSPIDSCNIDPSGVSACGGIKIKPGVFPPGESVSIEVSYISVATFINTNITISANSTTPAKRAVNSIGQYEVVKNGDGSVIGQIVGNGKKYTFGVMPISAIEVCLDLDNAIPQDKAKYPVMDMVRSVDNTLGFPMGVNITLSGAQYCGYVAPFLTATYIPVLRNEVKLANIPVQDLTGGTADRNATAKATTPNGDKDSGPSRWFLLVPLLASLLF